MDLPIETVIPWLLTIFFGLCTLYFSRKNLFRDEEHDIEEDTKSMVKLEVMLETIGSDIRDIKIDNRNIQRDLKELSERTALTEQSLKTLHHRVDAIEQRPYNNGSA